jgi:hypothetical protein
MTDRITAEQLAELNEALAKATTGDLVYSPALDMSAPLVSVEPFLSLARQHMPAPSVRRAGSSWRWKRATSWPDEIGLVTYSKTPLSRVSQKARKP